MRKQQWMAWIVIAALAALPGLADARGEPKGRILHGWGALTINDIVADEAWMGILVCQIVPGELNPFGDKPGSGREDLGGICRLDCRETVPPPICRIQVNEKDPLVDRLVPVRYNVCFDPEKDGTFKCPFPKATKFFAYQKIPGFNDVVSLYVSQGIKYSAVAFDP